MGLGVALNSHTATCISLGNSNFISAAVLDISRKATAVKETLLVDCIPVHKVHVSPAASFTANVC